MRRSPAGQSEVPIRGDIREQSESNQRAIRGVDPRGQSEGNQRGHPQSPSVAAATPAVRAFDREALVLPLIEAIQLQANNTLATAGDRSQQLTRVLRDALHVVLAKLHYGQVLLATVGSTAPLELHVIMPLLRAMS